MSSLSFGDKLARYLTRVERRNSVKLDLLGWLSHRRFDLGVRSKLLPLFEAGQVSLERGKTRRSGAWLAEVIASLPAAYLFLLSDEQQLSV